MWERPAAKASPPETLVEFPNINDVSIPFSIELLQPIIPHPDPSSVLPSPEIKLVSEEPSISLLLPKTAFHGARLITTYYLILTTYY